MPRLSLSSRSTVTALFLGCAGDRENDPAPKPVSRNGLNHRGDIAPKWASPWLSAEPVIYTNTDHVYRLGAGSGYGAGPYIFQLRAPVRRESVLDANSRRRSGTKLGIRAIGQTDGSACGRTAQHTASGFTVQRRDAERTIEQPIVSRVADPRSRGEYSVVPRLEAQVSIPRQSRGL